MVYAEDSVRHIRLKKSKLVAERCLAEIAEVFAQKIGHIQMILVFNNTDLNFLK